ncbi:MAG: hypothetical protein K0S66_706 [Sphingomonas sp.]|nr:hypothetical protein [Sphingomonas sp.]
MQHVPAQEMRAGSAPLTGLRAVSTATPPTEGEVVIARPGSVPGASRAGLEIVLSRARVGILHRDLDRRVLLVNDAFCALVGRPPEELAGLPFEEFTHPDDRDRSSRLYREQLAKAEPFEIEKRYIRPDGTASWCAVHVSFVLDAAGRPQSTITVASDITARHEAQQGLLESEEHYRHTVELAPQIAWSAAADGAVMEVNSRWSEITGIGRKDSLHDSWLQALHPDDIERTRIAWRAAVSRGEPIDITYRLLCHGTARWFRARAAPRTDAAGEVIRWYGTLEDIHEQRTTEQALRDSEERFRLAAQAAGLGIWDYDAVHQRREWSAEFKDMLGLSPHVIPSLDTAMAVVVPEDRHLLQALATAAWSGDSSAQFDVTLRVRRANDLEERWMQTSGWRIRTSTGRLERILVTIRDVTEERTAKERIRWTATHDALTGIPNRSHFTGELESALAATTPGSQLALVLLDLDHLKEMNDTIGHDAGDMLLKTFARRLQQAFGPRAAVGRLGGDEFAVLLTGVAGDRVQAHVERALLRLREPFEFDGHTCDTQATAGAALFPTHGTTADELLKSADIALYVGKAHRRGEMSLFQPAMRAEVQRRASMLNVARVAVRDNLIVPFYQPKICLATGRIAGFEALLRWHHDLLGVQGPDTIASAFDDLGLAIAIGDRMLAGIATDMRRWMDQGAPPVPVALNLSPAEFRHDGLVDRITRPFQERGVPFDRIELEITETVLLGRDTDRLEATLATFHDHGFRIALDDFGTGYASLTHLKAFPVDVIKIDKTFVSNLRADSDDAAIADAIITLAQRLDMEVVAEGVEQAEQARYLARRGCDYAQGFLFSEALPADEAIAMLRSSTASRGDPARF